MDKKTLNESLKVQVDVLWWVEIGSSCRIRVAFGTSFSLMKHSCVLQNLWGERGRRDGGREV